MRRHGLEFKRHYAGSTACAPSRATLFTGQYPSVHGVSQTSGVAKSAAEAMELLKNLGIEDIHEFLESEKAGMFIRDF